MPIEINESRLEEPEESIAGEDDAEPETDPSENNDRDKMRNDPVPVRYNNFNAPVKNNDEMIRFEIERENEILPHNSNGVMITTMSMQIKLLLKLELRTKVKLSMKIGILPVMLTQES
jgi:hypothetical protein